MAEVREDGGCREIFVVTDRRFGLHSPEAFPECPARLGWAMEGVLAAAGGLGLAVKMKPPPAPEAVDRLIHEVHSPRYLFRLRELAAGGGGALSLDTEVSTESFDVARLAVSAACHAVQICTESLVPAIALVRPPGHHAGVSSGTGFCLLNNAAVAARHAQTLAARGTARVAIVDWDVHHGNGTDEIFTADPDVLYVSMHEFPLYPYSGWTTECGTGAGEGRTVNLPLPGGLTDAQALEAFRRVVMPVLAAFAPAAILVSAGQDGHWRDPMSSWRLTAAGYAGMAGELAGFASRTGMPPPAVTLEGGYSASGMAASFAGIAAGLTELDWPALEDLDRAAPPEPSPRQKDAFQRRLDEIVSVQARYWPVA